MNNTIKGLQTYAQNNSVSIIIPIYNVEKYLPTCIQSILNQTYQNLEILLIDDGSTDTSGTICDTYAKKDSRIRVIHKENGGLSDARNTGLKVASGEWILFVDSDDFIHPRLVEIGVKGIQKFQADVVTFDYLEVGESATEPLSDMELMLWDTFSGTEMLEEFLRNGTGYVMSWNKMYHHSIWEELSFPKGKIHEDEFVITDIWTKANKVAVTNQKLYYYRQREGSIMSTRELSSYYDGMEAGRLRCEKLKDNEEYYCLSLRSYWWKIMEAHQKEITEPKRQELSEKMYELVFSIERILKRESREKQKKEWYDQEIEFNLGRMIELYPKIAKPKKKELLLQVRKRLTVELKQQIRRRQWFLWKLFSISPLSYQIGIKFLDSVWYRKMKKGSIILLNFYCEKKRIASYYQSPEFKRLKKYKKVKKILLLDTPTHGNLGDAAIAIAEREFIKQECPGIPILEFTQRECVVLKDAIRTYLTDEDIIIIPGGGFLGSLWKYEEDVLLELLECYRQNRVVIFPQTVYFNKDANGEQEKETLKKAIERAAKLKLFLREEMSWRFMLQELKVPKQSCFLVPDIVTYLSDLSHLCSVNGKKSCRDGVLLCIRKDKEKVLRNEIFNELLEQFPGEWKVRRTDTVIQKEVPREAREEEVGRKLEEFSEARLVITDRLHGMIFAALAGTPCIALDNISKKVSGVYEWLRYLDYVKVIQKEELTIQLVQEMIELGGCVYQNEHLRVYYERIKKELLEWKEA